MKTENKNVKSNLYRVSIICSVIAIILCIIGIVTEFMLKTNDYILWALLLLINTIIFIGNVSNRKNLK